MREIVETIVLTEKMGGITSLNIFLTKELFYIKESAYQYNGVLKTKASKKFGAFFCYQSQKRRTRHVRVESL
jgi:hypothetical protein